MTIREPSAFPAAEQGLADLLNLAEQAHGSGSVAGLLDAAHGRATGVADLERLAVAVARLLPGDLARLAAVQEALDRARKRQTRHAELQRMEREARHPHQQFDLAQRAVVELQDRDLARRLLVTAEAGLAGQPYDLAQYRGLLLAVDALLDDRVWLERLLEYCAGCSQHFAWLRDLCRIAATEFAAQPFGRDQARRLYDRYERSLLDTGPVSTYDLTKLALAVFEDLTDEAWAGHLLEAAGERARDHFEFAQVGDVFRVLGDRPRTHGCYELAAQACRTGGHAQQLVRRLRGHGVDEGELRALYRIASESITAPLERLRWVEGVVDMFRDLGWARDAYGELEGEFSQEPGRSRFLASREHRLGQRFY